MEGVGLGGGGAHIVAVATGEVEVATPPGMGNKQLQEVVVPPASQGGASQVVQVEGGSALSADRRVRAECTCHGT